MRNRLDGIATKHRYLFLALLPGWDPSYRGSLTRSGRAATSNRRRLLRNRARPVYRGKSPPLES
jgi:hypothetical protein